MTAPGLWDKMKWYQSKTMHIQIALRIRENRYASVGESGGEDCCASLLKRHGKPYGQWISLTGYVITWL